MTRLYTAFTSVFLLCCMIGSPLASQAQSCKGKSSALEAIGSVSGAMIYNTYLTIGAVADGHGCKVYDDAMVKELMKEQITMLGSVDSSYISLLNSGFLSDTSDISYAKEIRVTLALIVTEVHALNTFATSGLSSDADYYETCRVKAWDAIKKLLDLTD